VFWGRLKPSHAVQTGALWGLLISRFWDTRNPALLVQVQTVQHAQSCNTFRACQTNGADDLSMHRLSSTHVRHNEFTIHVLQSTLAGNFVLEILVDTGESKCIKILAVDSMGYFEVAYLHILLQISN